MILNLKICLTLPGIRIFKPLILKQHANFLLFIFKTFIFTFVILSCCILLVHLDHRATHKFLSWPIGKLHSCYGNFPPEEQFNVPMSFIVIGKEITTGKLVCIHMSCYYVNLDVPLYFTWIFTSNVAEQRQYTYPNLHQTDLLKL